jgi:diacylglycerol kinase (ATP)
MWVVEEMIKNQIIIENCPVAIMPFGTGNDFSRVLGWGPDTSIDLGNKLKFVKKHAHKWIEAVVDDFDVWEVKMETHSEGYFSKIKKTSNGFLKEHV